MDLRLGEIVPEDDAPPEVGSVHGRGGIAVVVDGRAAKGCGFAISADVWRPERRLAFSSIAHKPPILFARSVCWLRVAVGAHDRFDRGARRCKRGAEKTLSRVHPPRGSQRHTT